MRRDWSRSDLTTEMFVTGLWRRVVQEVRWVEPEGRDLGGVLYLIRWHSSRIFGMNYIYGRAQ